MGGRFLHNVPAELPVHRGVVIVMAPGPMMVQVPIPVRIQHLRVLFRKPGRGRGCGRTEDHLHALFQGQIQETVKKIIGIHTLPGFYQVPGKFRDTDRPKPCLQHPVQVLCPQTAIPVLRVVADTQLYLFSVCYILVFHSISPFRHAGILTVSCPSLHRLLFTAPGVSAIKIPHSYTSLSNFRFL